MKKNNRVEVKIFDQLEGLICTFPCKTETEGQALFDTLVAQPSNDAYHLILLSPTHKPLRERPADTQEPMMSSLHARQ